MGNQISNHKQHLCLQDAFQGAEQFIKMLCLIFHDHERIPITILQLN